MVITTGAEVTTVYLCIITCNTAATKRFISDLTAQDDDSTTYTASIYLLVKHMHMHISSDATSWSSIQPT